MIQLNFLREAGVYTENSSGLFEINSEVFFAKITDLAKLILKIQIEGDYKKAGEIMNKYANIPENLKKEIESLKDIPRDINTKYLFK